MKPMKRLGINLLATVITLIGATALDVTSAEAAMRGGCEDLSAAKSEFVAQCADAGGTSYQCSTSCSSEGYSMDCTCYA